MEQRLHTLIDDTLRYLHQLKEESPYVLCDTPYVAPSIPATSIDLPEQPPIKTIEAFIPTALTPLKPHAPEPLASSVPTKEPILEKPSPTSATAPLCSQHPPKVVHKDSMEDLFALITKIAPTVKLHHSIPNDTEAKKIKNAWKEQSHVPDVVILAMQSPYLPFLHQVAKAIELHFFSSRVIEVKSLEERNTWEAFLNTPNLKMIITPDDVLWSCKHLLRYYQEFPNKQERFLGKVPLVLLPEPSLYLKDPSLKRSLWNLLCHMLKPLQR